MSLSRLFLPTLLVLATSPAVRAQSTAASEASAYSVAPSVEVSAELLSLISPASGLVVQAIRPLGASVELVLVSATAGTSVVLELSAEVLHGLGVVVGTTVSVTAVTAGFLLSVGAEVIAFVPDAVTLGLIHHAELHR